MSQCRVSLTTIGSILIFACVLSHEHAFAQSEAFPTNSLEDFAFRQIKAFQEVNFNKTCGTSLPDPRAADHPDWKADCRRLSGDFFRKIFVQMRDEIPIQGVVIVGAHIVGGLDLSNVRLNRPLTISESRIDGKIDLTSTRTDSSFTLMDSVVEGELDAHALRSEMSVDLSKTVFRGNVLFDFARIDGYLDLADAVVAKAFKADSLQLGGSIFLESRDNRSVFNLVSLRSAKIGRNVVMDRGQFDGTVDLDSLQTDGALFMRSAKFSAPLILNKSRTMNDVNLKDSNLVGILSADGSQIGASLILKNLSSVAPVKMISVRAGGNFEICGVKLAQLDLSGSTFAGDLRLSGIDNCHEALKIEQLSLRNVRVGNLVDKESVWNGIKKLYLDGFSFAYLGGAEGDSEAQMRGRGAAWWDNWARRDPEFTPAPYEQLARLFAAAGDRGAADNIRFCGRSREPGFTNRILQYVAGFGIGDYTFRVLGWVFFISAGGALYLWFAVPYARYRGGLWYFGATLNRLLPIVEINKEFSDFFNDPSRSRLTGFQSIVFSMIAVIGWVLGAILIAAVSGITDGN